MRSVYELLLAAVELLLSDLARDDLANLGPMCPVEVADLAQDAEDLFLVDDLVVGRSGDLVKSRVPFARLLVPMLDVDILVHGAVMERARSSERIHVYALLEGIRTERPAHISHRTTLKLEDPDDVVLLKALQRLLIGQVDVVEIIQR